ncbi:SAM-dependent methyltransferase [Metallosphaera hakonensis]|uniref:Cobalt-factor III C(17)-methyltransferase n=1 Tax=Metallosphaera hakonensis JCM 8857 = DSM 7519 TaxID=1293036 RepID=A0A2U9IUE5_9CREN|nr:SAM-dependent methyltransferase [Metallosphaera hakonensis]AWR99644.1 cobalt-factor III C(17)-methyltransferase [Metallosphaera hakonensis JCM 8857 = DSM 7519]
MIKVVGIGAGGKTITLRAIEEISNAQILIGYSRYIDMIREYIGDNTQIIESQVDEVELRVKQALFNRDMRTVIISSGDPMVFGMGSRLYRYADEIVPGITAISLAASSLKIPLDDYSIINASTFSNDLKEVLLKLEKSLEARFTVGIYNINPINRKNDALAIEKLIKEKATAWNYYIVRNAMKNNEFIFSGIVKDLDITQVSMDSILILKRWIK